VFIRGSFPCPPLSSGNNFRKKWSLLSISAAPSRSAYETDKIRATETTKQATAMRFLMMMIPRVYQPSTPEAERAGEGFTPPREGVQEMMKFNEELAKAGMLVSLDGLHPLLKGARVDFAKGKGNPTVLDGPFIEAKEVVGGFWVLEADSKEQVVEWARRCPAEAGDVLEIRQIFALEDFAN